MAIFQEKTGCRGACTRAGGARRSSAAALGAADPDSTVASFGGAYGESQQKAYAVPFEAAKGTHVEHDGI